MTAAPFEGVTASLVPAAGLAGHGFWRVIAAQAGLRIIDPKNTPCLT
ncbi:MAG: hypothetical protein ACU837_00965 [Gammaproteobacteria bacterium]